jgi:hypothetical protein
MTLISTLVIDKYPILIGDILISGIENLGDKVSIPTIGNVHEVFPEGSGFTITGLRQKINLISDDCVIAWAGDMLPAMLVIKELREIAAKELISFDRLSEYFNNIREDIQNLGHFQITGWVKEPKGLRSFGFPYCNRYNSSESSHIITYGTGSEMLYESLINFTFSSNLINGSPNVLESAVVKTLARSSVFLQHEMMTNNSLLNFFGGGYEIATLVNGKFQKVGDITYVFWQVQKIGDTIQVLFPIAVFKYEYLNDILLIRSAHFKEDPNNKSQLSVDDSLYLVQPLYRPITKEEIKALIVPSMNSRFTCHCIFTGAVLELPTIPCWYINVQYAFNRNPNSIIFDDEESHLLAKINQQFVQDILASINRGIPESR